MLRNKPLTNREALKDIGGDPSLADAQRALVLQALPSAIRDSRAFRQAHDYYDEHHAGVESGKIIEYDFCERKPADTVLSHTVKVIPAS